jgi:hypothetical protein
MGLNPCQRNIKNVDSLKQIKKTMSKASERSKERPTTLDVRGGIEYNCLATSIRPVGWLNWQEHVIRHPPHLEPHISPPGPSI